MGPVPESPEAPHGSAVPRDLEGKRETTDKGTPLILPVRGPSANRPESHEPLGRSRSIGGGHLLSGTRETWAAAFAQRKVLHDAASSAPKRKRPCVTNRSGEPV